MIKKDVFRVAMVWGSLLAGSAAVAADPPATPYGARAGEAVMASPVQAPGVLPASTPVVPPPSTVEKVTPAAPAVTSQPAPVEAPLAAVTQPPALPPGSVCSPWSGPGGTGCCGPIGGNGPIMGEFFVRNGIALPVAGGIFNNTLNPAYAFSAGARSLFFNVPGDKAWVIEYGFDYFYNNGNHPEMVFSVPTNPNFFDLRDYHRAGIHLGIGREWFLFAPAYQCGTNFRWGLDTGGKWGYHRLNVNLPDIAPGTDVDPTFIRFNDAYGSFYAAIHADYEHPITSCATFIFGVRGEYAFTFNDILRTIDTDLQEAIISINMGMRF